MFYVLPLSAVKHTEPEAFGASESIVAPPPVAADGILGGDSEEGAQFSFVSSDLLGSALVEETAEHVLGEVFGISRREPLPAREGIDRQPVSAADLLQGAVPQLAVIILHLQDHAPTRVGEGLIGAHR